MITNKPIRIQLGKLKKTTVLTHDSGKVLLSSLYRQLGIGRYINKGLMLYKRKGYNPSDLLLDMMWLQLKGGEYVWDMKDGYTASVSTYYRLLSLFAQHPEALGILEALQAQVVKQYYLNHPTTEVTLDQDATLIPSDKRMAAYCYKGDKAYHPMMIYDGRICVAHAFRSGEASPMDVMPVFKQAYARLPTGVKVSYRGDSASYNTALIQFCDGHDIDYAIGCRMCNELRRLIQQQTDWVALEADLDYTELPHVTDWSEKHHRFIVTRRRHTDAKQAYYEQQELDLGSKMMKLSDHHYTLSVIITNRQDDLASIIGWYHQRCGYGETMHHELKSDLAGSHLPSQHLEANAAWWHITVLAYNLQQFINHLAFTARYRMKRIRYKLMVVPARLIKHARGYVLQLHDIYYEQYNKILQGIMRLNPG